MPSHKLKRRDMTMTKKIKIRIGDEVRVRGNLPENCPVLGLNKNEIYIITDIEPDYDEQYFAPLSNEVSCMFCEYYDSCEKVLHTDPVDLRLVSLTTRKGKIIADKYDILWFIKYNPNA
jgi:hypothetical protein